MTEAASTINPTDNSCNAFHIVVCTFVNVVFAVVVQFDWLMLEMTDEITQMPMNKAIAADITAMTDCVTIPFLAINSSFCMTLIGKGGI